MKNWKKIIAYLLGFGSLGSGTALVLDYALTMASPEVENTSPKLVSESAPTAREKTINPIDSNTEIREDDFDDWEEIFRTSDLEGEQATQYSRRRFKKEKDIANIPPLPAGAKRIGCLCMDDVEQEKKGSGACAGRGGVRFWIYELTDGKIHQHPTERHLFHPESLTELELSNLSAHQEEEAVFEAPYNRGRSWQFYEMMTVIFVCITVSFIAYLYFGQGGKA